MSEGENDEDLHVNDIAVARNWENLCLVSYGSSSHCPIIEMSWQEAAHRKL